MMVLGAWLVGLWRVCRSAWLVPVAYLLLLVATVPLALVLHRDLPQPATPSTIEPGAGCDRRGCAVREPGSIP